MSTENQVVESAPSEQSNGPLTAPDNVKEALAANRAMLSEARNTRMLLEDFKAAIEGASYHGSKMLHVAKGLAFIDILLGQNKGHIQELQTRLGDK